MYQEFFPFTGARGTELPGVLWLPDSEPRLLLQITHGMTEHMGRYENFAQKLTDRGIAAAGFDLRGHGKNPGDPHCAFFGEGGWADSLEDMHCFYEVLAEKFPGLPHAMLGFSLGSFLLRDFLNQSSDPVSAALILGTGYQPGPVLALLKNIVRGQIRKAGFDRTTPLVRRLSFETYNRNFAPNRTPADWLCADERELDTYRDDPLCREDISAGLFWQLLDSMQRTGSAAACENWSRDMPVCLLSGQDDPVGSAGKGVQQTAHLMKKAGISRMRVHLLPGGRHDILHEVSGGQAEAAMNILCNFLTDTLPRETR